MNNSAQDREMHAANTIKGLYDEMDALRNNSQPKASPTTLDKFIKHDYFYNEVNTIPRNVHFA